jgi:hypothetical protein
LAVINVLEWFHLKYPEDNVLKKWGVNIAAGVHKVYNQYGMTVCSIHHIHDLDCCNGAYLIPWIGQCILMYHLQLKSKMALK